MCPSVGATSLYYMLSILNAPPNGPPWVTQTHSPGTSYWLLQLGADGYPRMNVHASLQIPVGDEDFS